MNLTVCILTRNNQVTISECLTSIKALNAQILVLDAGSRDQTKQICKKMGVQVQDIEFMDDYSSVKNKLADKVLTGWLFFLEPWECLIAGFEAIIEAMTYTPELYAVQLIQGDIITKPVRLWHSSQKIRFNNPIYESVREDPTAYLDVVIASSEPPRLDEKEKIVRAWVKNKPTAADPQYYLACLHLSRGRYDDFLRVAEHYLFLENKGTSAIMTRYYVAMIQCYKKNQVQKAIGNILSCIATNPTMAEFWCLLGDAYYQVKAYEKAVIFYDNAIVLGSRRKINTHWPLEISKYEEYPKKMIASCESIIASTTRITS
jgi:glycosyltransferase involved in cell wall biosynthesis